VFESIKPFCCIIFIEIMPIRIWGIFALNPSFLKFVALFMQLVHEIRPKPFHYDLGTKPIHPLPKISQKIFSQKPSFEIWGFRIFDQTCGFWGHLDHLNSRLIPWSSTYDLDRLDFNFSSSPKITKMALTYKG
jgi:hypothetical protein